MAWDQVDPDIVIMLNSLGRTMRLIAMNMDNGLPVSTNILIQALQNQRDLIDTVLPRIPPNKMIELNTRLGPATEDLIASTFPDVPDYPPEHWST